MPFPHNPTEPIVATKRKYHDFPTEIKALRDENKQLRAELKELEGRDEFHEYAIKQWLVFEKESKKETNELRAKLADCKDAKKE